jgi:hypothetical protein
LELMSGLRRSIDSASAIHCHSRPFDSTEVFIHLYGGPFYFAHKNSQLSTNQTDFTHALVSFLVWFPIYTILEF